MAEEKTKSKTDPALSQVLYDRCAENAQNSDEKHPETFDSAALLVLCECDELKHIQDGATLMPVIQILLDAGLFRHLSGSLGSCWTIRPRDEAAKWKVLDSEERLVYGLIENTLKEGAWIHDLKLKSGIKDSKTMNKVLKSLVKSNLVKTVGNVRSSAKKLYMLTHFVPTEDITGGSFYEAGQADESLIDDIANLIIFHVRQMSWYEEKRKHIKRESSPILIRDDDATPSVEVPPKEPSSHKKRKRDTNATSESKDIEDAAPRRKRRSHGHSHDTESSTIYTQIPFTAGHEYPTATSIHEYITNSNILKDVKAQSLTVAEMQNMLNVLVWDGKLEIVNKGYRSARGAKFKMPGEEVESAEDLARKRGNGLTEMPCGRCPVSDLCGTGKPISAKNCVYFEEWLGMNAGTEVF